MFSRATFSLLRAGGFPLGKSFMEVLEEKRSIFSYKKYKFSLVYSNFTILVVKKLSLELDLDPNSKKSVSGSTT
jgi:hypothetical protein